MRVDRLRALLVPLLAAPLFGCGAAHQVAAPAGGTPGSAGGSASAAPTAPGPASAASSPKPFDIGAHSTTDPRSIWVVVNKTHPITPSSYRPEVALVRGYQVARPAAPDLTWLLDAGDARGLGLKIASAFRSFAYQRGVHDQLAAQEGAAAADRVSARPGFSEHQTGLAVDLITPATPRCDLDQCFASTRAGRWLAQRSWRYGFIVRYTRGNQAVTGYEPEPWHLRYVGRPLAAAMHTAGVTTLEEFLHVPGGEYR